jgi:ankyrin repeat protein
LIKAALRGQRATVDLLLDHKASIDAQSKSGSWALYAAARVGAVDVVRTLLERGANVNMKSVENRGRTALHAVAEQPTTDVVQLLLDKCADINAQSTDGVSPLLDMIKGGTKAATPVALLLIQRGADVNATSDDGETTLTLATARRMTAVVRALLDKGADPNKGKPIPSGPSSSAGGPPLLIALSDRSVPESAEIALLLIERGADVNARGTSGNTPLIRALIGKYDAVVRALLEKGADPNMSNGPNTPLLAAGSNEEMRKLLIAAGANPQ